MTFLRKHKLEKKQKNILLTALSFNHDKNNTENNLNNILKTVNPFAIFRGLKLRGNHQTRPWETSLNQIHWKK